MTVCVNCGVLCLYFCKATLFKLIFRIANTGRKKMFYLQFYGV